ncbi:MAG: CRISPR-associated protein [Monoglobaceae bacterium]
MFINYSNHPISTWAEKQRLAAAEYGKTVDMPFPQISASAGEADIDRLAALEFEKIMRLAPDCVLCQGEMSFCFNLINRLKSAGVTVVAACSERTCAEKTLSDGSTIKQSVFNFVQFRKYL